MPNTDVHKLKLELVTQGDTGAASRVKITAEDTSGNRLRNHLVARCRICNDGVFADSTNATIAIANGSTLAETITSTKDLVIQSEKPVKATVNLTLTGGGKHLEQIVTGPRVYVLDALGTLNPGATNQVMVDISANAVASQGTLTIAEQITAGDTMTIGSKNYLFVAHGLANEDGEISIGPDEATAKLNIVKAILGTDGFNTANADVTCAAAFATDDLIITARIPGTIGDAIATTETLTHGSNVFDAATLGTTTAGADPTSSQTATAIRAAINGDGARVANAAGSSGTVALTAVDPGSDFNSYASTETMANGSFGASTFGSGSDDESGTIYVDVTCAQAETNTFRVGNPPVGGLLANCAEELDITHAAP